MSVAVPGTVGTILIPKGGIGLGEAHPVKMEAEIRSWLHEGIIEILNWPCMEPLCPTDFFLNR